MLNDFFRINLPYGIARNENGGWMVFNREYMPLGYNNVEHKGNPGLSFLDIPIYTRYKRLTEKLLIELAYGEHGVMRNEKNEIVKVFLYNDGTNPQNQSTDKKILWDNYFEKLKKLSKLNVDK